MSDVQRTRWLTFMGLYESSLIIRPGNIFVYQISPQAKKRRIKTYLNKRIVEKHNIEILK